MALTQQQKSEIRRHLKYGNIGLSTSLNGGGSLGANASIYAFDHWGELEVRMNSLAPLDCAAITGSPSGILTLQGPDPNPGDSLQIQLAGGNLASTQTVTMTASNGQNRTNFALGLSGLCAQNAVIGAAGIQPFFPYDEQDVSQEEAQNLLTEIDFISPVPFTLSIVSASGQIGASILSDGSLYPNPQVPLNKVLYYGFLPVLNALYGLIFGSSDRLAVDKADVFTARKTEIKERRGLYEMLCNDLANFLIIPQNQHAPAGVRSNQCYL